MDKPKDLVTDGGPITPEVVAAGLEALRANRPPRDHVYGCECDLCNPITHWVPAKVSDAR